MKKEDESERQGAHPDVPAEPELKKLGPGLRWSKLRGQSERLSEEELMGPGDRRSVAVRKSLRAQA